jgi:hypothetical protein
MMRVRTASSPAARQGRVRSLSERATEMFRAITLNGRGTLTSFWGLFWILVCLHQLYFGWFMVRSSFVPYVMDGNETFSVWWHSHKTSGSALSG